MNPDELPPDIKHAFENYPQVEPSPAFNRAVLQSLAAAQSARKLTLVGRIEELLGLKWWQFAASGMLGALLPTIVLGAMLSNRGAAPPADLPNNPLLPRAIGPLYARELWRENESEIGAYQPRPAAPFAQSHAAPLKQGDELSWAASNSPLV